MVIPKYCNRLIIASDQNFNLVNKISNKIIKTTHRYVSASYTIAATSHVNSQKRSS